MNEEYLQLCDFDHERYRMHADLKSMSNAQLENHFFQYGIREGRIYNHVDNRKSFLDLVEKKGNVLEIGPLDKPLMDPHSPNYFSLDVFTREQLIHLHLDDPGTDKTHLVEPSYVIKNNDYSVIREKFNCIFSSHNIEHMPCLVTFLQNLESVLAEDGSIYLAVPDKRYCFDHFKKETDIYDVLQSYQEKNSRPRLMDVLKMKTQVTHNNAVDHWKKIHGKIDPENVFASNYEAVLEQYNTGVYMDCHVSFFTPQSFLEIFRMLKELKLVQLEIRKMYHTLEGTNEFFVILKK